MKLRESVQRDVEMRQVDIFRSIRSLRDYLVKDPNGWEFVDVSDMEADLVALAKLLGDASRREAEREAVKAREDAMAEAA